jgi:hypothetical protein
MGKPEMPVFAFHRKDAFGLCFGESVSCLVPPNSLFTFSLIVRKEKAREGREEKSKL